MQVGSVACTAICCYFEINESCHCCQGRALVMCIQHGKIEIPTKRILGMVLEPPIADAQCAHTRAIN